jgi:molybdopterin molybdotransferase
MTVRETARATVDIPVFDNSAMDGFAVRHADVADASADHPVTLRVVADIPAGSDADPILAPGEAARIMTGSPVPADADAIVPFEDTVGGLADSLTQTTVLRAPRPAAHIRRAGEDLRAGDPVLGPGTLLGPLQLGAIAAAGITDVVVSRRPRVAIVSTGSELVEAGAPAPRTDPRVQQRAAGGDGRSRRCRGRRPHERRRRRWRAARCRRCVRRGIRRRHRVLGRGQRGCVRSRPQRTFGDDDVLARGHAAGQTAGIRCAAGRRRALGAAVRPAWKPGERRDLVRGVRPARAPRAAGAHGDPPAGAAPAGIRRVAHAARSAPISSRRRRHGRGVVGAPRHRRRVGSHLAGGLGQARAVAIVPAEVDAVAVGDEVDVWLLEGWDA